MNTRHDKTDYQRWQDLRNHRATWDHRNELIAQRIPAGASVFEFGAGRCILAEMIPPDCRYTDSDLVARSDNSFVVDLNARPLPMFPKSDYAIFSGVLEYLQDNKSLIQHLPQSFNNVICSYIVTEIKPDQAFRTSRDWHSNYSKAQLIKLFAAVGYECEEVVDCQGQQLIFVFHLKSAVIKKVA